MMGSTEEFWTLQCGFTGDTDIHIVLRNSDMQTLWKGNPSTDIVTVRVPPKSTLILSFSIGAYDVILEDGCLVESLSAHDLNITVFQSEAQLELRFVR